MKGKQVKCGGVTGELIDEFADRAVIREKTGKIRLVYFRGVHKVVAVKKRK